MMTTLAVLGIGGWEMVLILAVVLVLFGAKRLPELAKGLGTGIKEFKKATRDVTDELHRSMEDYHHNQAPPRKQIDYPVEEAKDVTPAKTEVAGTVAHGSHEPK